MLAPLDPQRLPPGTGRGVRIVVIDSGVHVAHPHIRSVAGGVCIHPDGTVEDNSFQDRLGHGTAVMAAIQEKAPDAEYIAVKLFHTALRSSLPCLLRAIEWATGQHADLINLSLGTTSPQHADLLAAAVAKASANGAMLVSAREVAGSVFYPGSLPGVVGVCLDSTLDRHSHRTEATPQGLIYYASGHPRPIDGVPPHRNLNGISFAVANMTGILARGLADRHAVTYFAAAAS